MESNVVVEANESKKTVTGKALTGWALGIAVCGLLASCIFGIVESKKVSSLENQVTKLDSQVTQDDKKISTMQPTVEDSYTWLGFQAFMHNVEGSVVTDDLVVNKATLTYSTGKLQGVVDVENQPTIALKYKGDGKYDVSDRELKGMLLALMEQLGSNYKDYFSGAKVPGWETANISLTVKNYELGTYSGGKVTLKGE